MRSSTQTHHLIAKFLREYGVDIYHTCTIGDNPHRIAEAIKEAHTRADIIISTGGLGPTVDDPTRQAAALAFDTELVFHESAWQQVIERFKKIQQLSNKQQSAASTFPRKCHSLRKFRWHSPHFLYPKIRRSDLHRTPLAYLMKCVFSCQKKVLPTLQEKIHLR